MSEIQYGRIPELEKQLHQKAKLLLSENKLEEAWLTLLAFNN